MASDESLQTTAPKAPVTADHRVNPNLDDQLPKPFLPRALAAVDTENISGTVPGHNHNGMSVLQQHVAFFDRNNDGIVYPWETYMGFRAVGFNIILSFVGSFLINLSMSYPTLPGWFPSPFFPIYIDRIHRAKHGSDSEVYDTEGRFLPSKFEEIFTKYSRTRPDRLTFSELWAMTEGNKNANDPFGWIANKVEWILAYILAKDDEGSLPKEAARGVFDGSLFEYCEKQRMSRKND
uniref:TSA: Wollemia nobilis Ref_Wollemi_Transcript_12239_832 transcribed RNA sequence n=1 Tax=Wollemia nobilis TaxID=56998 RepID=A0A0C9S875_9CONI